MKPCREKLEGNWREIGGKLEGNWREIGGKFSIFLSSLSNILSLLIKIPFVPQPGQLLLLCSLVLLLLAS